MKPGLKKENILDAHLATQKSGWRQDAEFLRENRDWLKVSREIALKILRAIREDGISQKELAQRLSVSPQQVSKWVKGKENFTIETLTRIERALGTCLISVANTRTQVRKAVFNVSLNVDKPEYNWGIEHREQLSEDVASQYIEIPDNNISEVA